MTQVYFAGVNTQPIAAATEGRKILISFASMTDSHRGAIVNEVLPRLRAGKYDGAILDSGAFTVVSKGITISVEDYGDFAQEHADLFDQVVNLDDIQGDLATSWRNQEYLEGLGLDVIPVFHQDEPWEVIEHYAQRYRRIGLGFARLPGGRLKHGRKVNRRFLEEAFVRIGDRAEVHGFAMTDWALREGFPFATVDSTTWIREFTGLRTFDSGPHHTAGHVAEFVRELGRDLTYKLALDSYAMSGYESPSNEDFLAHSKGQARTVFRRFTPPELDGWIRGNWSAA